MGKLDALLGRNFNTEKFNHLAKFAISRLAVLKNQRTARRQQSLSDVLQLLDLGQHERAVVRVELVIKDQDMLDVYNIMEGYFNLLIERIHLMKQERVCPEELKEAVSGLLYASSRCGDFPELQKIREIFISRFGKEFVSGAIDLGNNHGVNLQMVDKLSTNTPNVESRIRMLKQISQRNNIVLHLEENTNSHTSFEAHFDGTNNYKPDVKVEVNLHILPKTNSTGNKASCSEKFKSEHKYENVFDAAQAAYEAAAHAAQAARLAAQLSQPEVPHHLDQQNSSKNYERRLLDAESHVSSEKAVDANQIEVLKRRWLQAELKFLKSVSSSNSTGETSDSAMFMNGVEDVDPFEKDVVLKDGDCSDSVGKLSGSYKSVRQMYPSSPVHMRNIHESSGSETQSTRNTDKVRPFSLRTRRV